MQRPHANVDAVVVGAGPNGLCAAIVLAQAGWKVLVIEAQDEPGGGMRTLELTLPGFRHDMCAAVIPLAVTSPYLRTLPLEQYGVAWVYSPLALAHPLDHGPSVLVSRSIAETAAGLGSDAHAYQRLMDSVAGDWPRILPDLLGPIPIPPREILADIRFGVRALLPATLLARLSFRQERARALFAGMAGHSMLPIEQPITSAFALAMLATAHTAGWPVVRGGTQRLTEALVAYLRSLGGEIVTGWEVRNMEELPPARAVLFDLSPRSLMQIAKDRLPASYQNQLRRYRYGPGACKVDWALDGPIPWRDANASRSITVHLGGTLDEIRASERTIWRGEHAEKPFIILAQPSLFDASRAPQGKHTVWAYCHVPNGSSRDCTEQIEAQVERFAPGFRDLILARRTHTAMEMEAYNANYVGGDINNGAQDIFQFFTRPVISLSPYRTPARGIYLCSSATPPGGGVHGMCGYHAAQAVLRDARSGR